MGQVLSFNSSTKNKVRRLACQRYRIGDRISVLNLGIWQVKRGVVQLGRVCADGNEIIVGFVTTNGVFANILSNSSIVHRAIALSDVNIQYYSQQDLAEFPMLAKSLVENLGDRLIHTQQLLTIMSLNIEDRLRQLLLMFERDLGVPSADGVRLQIRFTHKHLAEIIGTTRETITKILGDFQRQGLICVDRDRHIIIKGLRPSTEPIDSRTARMP